MTVMNRGDNKGCKTETGPCGLSPPNPLEPSSQKVVGANNVHRTLRVGRGRKVLVHYSFASGALAGFGCLD